MPRWKYYLIFLCMMSCSYFMIMFAWMGAKYIFEGGINFSDLDRVITGFGAWYVARDGMSTYTRLLRYENQRGASCRK